MREKGRMSRLLFIGDSLIEFFDWQARFAEHEVFDFGVAGESVDELHRRLDAIISGIPSPDFVLIMSGINNLAMDDQDFAAPYASVIERLKRAYPSASIVIHSLLPTRTPFLANNKIAEINKELSALAERKGVVYADIYPLFLNKEGGPNALFLLEDGVHLSNEGYRVWSALLEEIITDTAER